MSKSARRRPYINQLKGGGSWSDWEAGLTQAVTEVIQVAPMHVRIWTVQIVHPLLGILAGEMGHVALSEAQELLQFGLCLGGAARMAVARSQPIVNLMIWVMDLVERVNSLAVTAGGEVRNALHPRQPGNVEGVVAFGDPELLQRLFRLSDPRQKEPVELLSPRYRWY